MPKKARPPRFGAVSYTHLEVTDRIYVYKDGTSVGSLDTRDADEAKLYEMMVGQSTTTEYYHLDRQTAPQDDVLLEAKDLGLHGIFKHVNFQLHRGEVLGLCGVVGSGAEEVCEVLCGDEKPSFGEIAVRGRAVRFRSPKQALREGILMIPKERLFEGIVSTLSVEDNIALSNAKQMAKGPFVSGAAVRRQAKHWIGELRIKTPGPQALLRQPVSYTHLLLSVWFLRRKRADFGFGGGDLPRHGGRDGGRT